MAVRVRETGNMGAVSEMMDDDQRDDGTGIQLGRKGKFAAAWKLEANPNPRMVPT